MFFTRVGLLEETEGSIGFVQSPTLHLDPDEGPALYQRLSPSLSRGPEQGGPLSAAPVRPPDSILRLTGPAGASSSLHRRRARTALWTASQSQGVGKGPLPLPVFTSSGPAPSL